MLGGGGLLTAPRRRHRCPQQLAVVQAPLDQAVCVLAAAGTGKTTTMSQRVRWMLEQVHG